MAAIKKSAEDHAKKIMESNNLKTDDFERILNNPPYNTTIKQFIEDTAFTILKSQLEAASASTIRVSDKEMAEAAAKNKGLYSSFDVVFISLVPKAGQTKEEALKYQFKRANEIRKEIIKIAKLDDIKRYYEKEKDVHIGEPIKYEPGTLLSLYEQELKKNNQARITEPFNDNGKVAMMLKIEVPKSNETALENVRKELYNKAAQLDLRSKARETLANVPVVINCERRTRF